MSINDILNMYFGIIEDERCEVNVIHPPEFATCNFKKNLKKSQNIGIFLLTFFLFYVIILVGG